MAQNRLGFRLKIDNKRKIMYVCVCKAVTDKQRISIIESGACTRRELTQCLGVVGKDGGKCSNEVKSLLK
jgi:bacterioferritin-associated ferredoxin